MRSGAPLLDPVARVTGAVPYMTNLRLPGALVARVLRSEYAHARIRTDVSAATALPGVAAVVSASDLETLAVRSVYGFDVQDQPIVARDRVRFVGEPIALVAAETAEMAEEALAAIDVTYDELPAVFDARAALMPGAPVLHEEIGPTNLLSSARLRHGDIDAGFAAADLVVEEIYTSPLAQHASIEPHACAAQWTDGRLTIWSGTQSPYQVRRVLAQIFALDPQDVRVIAPPIGGGYGGKGAIRLEPMVSLLARKAGGRPVMLVLSRAEEFVTVTKHAATIAIKSGVRRDGTLTARQVQIHLNAGAYADVSTALSRTIVVRSLGPYRLPAAAVECTAVYTNLPSAGAFRGAVANQSTWAYESHTDEIAHRLGLDPLEFRRRNLLKTGERFATGEELHNIHFEECLDAAASGLPWGRAEQPEDRRLRRGRGLAVMMKSTVPNSRSECRLEITADGRVTVHTSTVDMGQGAHTTLAIITARALGVPLARVRIAGPDTSDTPFDETTSSSRSTAMMGTAVERAAAVLLVRLSELAAPLLGAAPADLTTADGGVAVRGGASTLAYGEILRRAGVERLEATGEHATKGGVDPETGQGIATPHWHQGAGACEVEVDIETGQVRLVRYVAASFAGRVVNPPAARLQNDGNVVFGIGPALLEEMLLDSGRVTNANLSDYLIPSFRDAPVELESVLLEADGSEVHGIGEMTLPPVAPAIGNAVYDAVGVRIRDLPITAEKVLRALEKRGRQ